MANASNSKLVLIVDDVPTNIAILSGVLKQEGYRTKVATNGEKALLISAEADRPDLILLDVQMPGMDGYEVCKRLKRSAETRDIPVIFVTAQTEVQNEEEGFRVGAVDYIQKPFSGPIVRARVRSQLALQAAHRDAREAQRHADELLNALLPQAAADEIRSLGAVIPRRHENVAVLYADVADFNAFCEKHPAEEVVPRLDALFVLFEQIAAKHGIEKIKTVGGTFIAVGGLLNVIKNAAHATVQCSMEMATAANDARLGLSVRLAVHAGTVVSGVVGQERYQFDIWGDAVNVTFRLLDKARPGGVAVTQEIWKQVNFDYSGDQAGEIEIGGSAIPVFEVRGPKVELSRSLGP